MACFEPMRGYAAAGSGVWRRDSHSAADRPLTIPCGQCLGCRLDRVRDWTVRNLHELQEHDGNAAFVTLTYRDEDLPLCGPLEGLETTLVKADLQQFWKRLRYHLGHPVRYFACGEYGDQKGRPHYHAIVYGTRFPDRIPAPVSNASSPLFTSAVVADAWPFGHHTIGSVSWESIAYVARYTVKKLTGKRAHEYFPREPVFGTQSRRPGIGRSWFDRFSSEVYPSDSVVANGVEARPPRYYDKVMEASNEELLAAMRLKRKERAERLERNGNFARQRRLAKAAVLEQQQRRRDAFRS